MVTAIIGKSQYRTVITSRIGNVVIADEPFDLGGQEEGFDPLKLLAASLASCTAATLRMYADRKGWEIPEIIIKVDIVPSEQDKSTSITRLIETPGIHDQQVQKRLTDIANKCPLHKILTQSIVIDTSFV